MGEVATVAAIAGGLLTSGITGLVTWNVSKNSASVELVKIAAENHRLRYGNQEDERRNRQTTYIQFFDAATGVLQILGFPVSMEVRDEKCNEYNRLLAGLLVFSPPSVREGALALNGIYEEIWSRLEEQREDHPDKDPEHQWRDATSGLQSEFQDRGSALVELMHQDVTRGITSDDSVR